MATHDERLRDHDKWARSLRNYGWLDQVVSGATDIDLLTERRAHFLILEGKTWDHGVRVPIGQDIVLRQLDGIRAHTPHCEGVCSDCGAGYRPFTVYLVGEETVDVDEDADRFHVMRFGRPVALRKLYPSSLFTDATRDDLRQVVRQWEQTTWGPA